MSARPEKTPEWATDDTYDEPGEAWDGTDTKVEPTTVRQAEGWTPASRPAATYMNWWQHTVGAALAYLIHGPIANWTKHAVVDALGGAVLADLRFHCGVHNPVSGGGDGKVLLFGEFHAGSGDARAGYSYDLDLWGTEDVEDTASSPPDDIFGACIDTDNDLVIVVGHDSGNAYVFTRPQDGSTTWTQRAQPPGVAFRALAHGLSASGTVVDVAVGYATASDDARIYSSSNGTNWTVRDTSTDRPLYGVANAPGGNWVAVGDDTSGGATAGVAFSSPDGITWTERTVACKALRRVVWCPRAGLFFAAGVGGARATSPDGITWTDRTDTGAEWLAEDVIDVATDGEGTILVLGTDGSGDIDVYSVWCSTDGGLTWVDRAFPIVAFGSNVIPSCLFWAGPRFGWVIGGDVIIAGDPIVWGSART